MLRKSFLASLVAGLSLFGMGSAQAALIASLDPASPVSVGPNFAYNYTMVFGSSLANERLEPGDFITLYDVAGPLSPLVGTPTAPAGFTATTSLITPPAAGTAPFDNPVLTNVTFTYTGAPVTADTAFAGFGLVSTTNAVVNAAYTSETTDNAGPEAGTTIGHIGSVRGPLGIIPEPGTIALAAVGAVAALFVFRRKRRS